MNYMVIANYGGWSGLFGPFLEYETAEDTAYVVAGKANVFGVTIAPVQPPVVKDEAQQEVGPADG